MFWGVPGLIWIWVQRFGTFEGMQRFKTFEAYSRGFHASFWPFSAYFGGFQAWFGPYGAYFRGFNVLEHLRGCNGLKYLRLILGDSMPHFGHFGPILKGSRPDLGHIGVPGLIWYIWSISGVQDHFDLSGANLGWFQVWFGPSGAYFRGFHTWLGPFKAYSWVPDLILGHVRQIFFVEGGG